MPRRPDVPCAGDCGKLIWRGRGTLPPGESMCRLCRIERNRIRCVVCNVEFVARPRGGQRSQACSLKCGYQLRQATLESLDAVIMRECAFEGCEQLFTWKRTGNQKYCSKSCAKARVCEVCGARYEWSHMDQRTCGRACGVVLRRSLRPPPESKYPATKISWRVCDECGSSFAFGRGQRDRGRLRCSQECAKANKRRIDREYRQEHAPPPATVRRARCPECLLAFDTKLDHQIFCGKVCSARAYRRDNRGYRERARKYRVAYEPISRTRVFERDEWRCGICGGTVGPRLQYPHDLSPSLDHIVPMSLGGPHLYSNVQCAHLKCNVDKGATLPEELEVVA